MRKRRSATQQARRAPVGMALQAHEETSMANEGVYLVTGATGFVGSHVAEECVRRRIPVRTLARPRSDTHLLQKLGVEIVRGELGDPAALTQALADVRVVIHCAAKVGDWGPVEEYRRVNVEALRQLLEAARQRALQRFVHLSTLGVYEARDHFGTDESVAPPDVHMDGYTQSKVEAEKLVLHYHHLHGMPVVILRPGFIYGPRDRTVLPKLLENLRAGKVKYLGNPEKLMNTIGIDNLVQAIFLAVEKPQAIGRIYNLTDGEPVSKRRFLETVAHLAGVQPPRGTVPLWLARRLAVVMETIARWRGATSAPRLTRARLKFLGYNLDFSIERARNELGYCPQVPFDQGIRAAVDWWVNCRASA